VPEDDIIKKLCDGSITKSDVVGSVANDVSGHDGLDNLIEVLKEEFEGVIVDLAPSDVSWCNIEADRDVMLNYLLEQEESQVQLKYCMNAESTNPNWTDDTRKANYKNHITAIQTKASTCNMKDFSVESVFDNLERPTIKLLAMGAWGKFFFSVTMYDYQTNEFSSHADYTQLVPAGSSSRLHYADVVDAACYEQDNNDPDKSYIILENDLLNDINFCKARMYTRIINALQNLYVTKGVDSYRNIVLETSDHTVAPSSSGRFYKGSVPTGINSKSKLFIELTYDNNDEETVFKSDLITFSDDLYNMSNNISKDLPIFTETRAELYNYLVNDTVNEAVCKYLMWRFCKLTGRDNDVRELCLDVTWMIHRGDATANYVAPHDLAVRGPDDHYDENTKLPDFGEAVGYINTVMTDIFEGTLLSSCLCRKYIDNKNLSHKLLRKDDTTKRDYKQDPNQDITLDIDTIIKKTKTGIITPLEKAKYVYTVILNVVKHIDLDDAQLPTGSNKFINLSSTTQAITKAGIQEDLQSASSYSNPSYRSYHNRKLHHDNMSVWLESLFSQNQTLIAGELKKFATYTQFFLDYLESPENAKITVYAGDGVAPISQSLDSAFLTTR
jgi:hypothetical protein